MESNLAGMLWNAKAGATAIVTRDGEHSYARLRDRAAAMAVRLRQQGMEENDRVGIFLDRGLDAAAAFFGVLAAGGIAVNINETLRPRQIEYILAHAKSQILITAEDVLARQPRPLEGDVELLDVAAIPSAEDFSPVGRVSPDVAQIIYTSGSTGLPKGVTVSHGNLWAGVRSVTSYLAINADDRIASLLPFSFDYGLNQLLCAVRVSAALVVERSPLPQSIVATLRQQRVTVLPCVPPLWLRLLAAPDFRETLPALRAMTNTGGRLPLVAVRRLRDSQPEAKLFLMYGLTEAFRATYLPSEEVDRRPDSIGRAIPGSEILVLRDDGTRCAPGEVGEIVQRGPTVALGYWDDREATAATFRPNPTCPPGTPDGERVVYSGDLARSDEEGYLYFVGRRDTMIKSLGFRVSPDEVAEVLYASGVIEEGIVRAEPDEERGERIVAYVVLTEDGSVGELESFCRLELPRHLQPARIEVRDSLPRTASGKHDPGSIGPAPEGSGGTGR